MNEEKCLITKETEIEDLNYRKENSWKDGVQMFSSFLLAGCGMVAASLLLDHVQHWTVFEEVSEVFILIPGLLGLKGNLEMTLASRLSTHSHLGHLNISFYQLLVGNLCLIQCQAIVVSGFAAGAAVAVGWIYNVQFEVGHALVLSASSMLTASLTSFVLSLVTVSVVLISRKVNINPDNVAAPIAASLGDIITLSLLAYIASVLYSSIAASQIITIMIIIISTTIVPACGFVAWRNAYTKQALLEGWGPVLSAMAISIVGGLIFHYTVSSYEGIALFQLIINGVGGDMAAVRASKLSTSLHTGWKEESVLGSTSRLLVLAVPLHLIFMFIIAARDGKSLSVTFVLLYISAALLQISILLIAGYFLVMKLWKMGLDPDNTAIPYLTALGDLLGTAFLGVAFYIFYAIGDQGGGLEEQTVLAT